MYTEKHCCNIRTKYLCLKSELIVSSDITQHNYCAIFSIKSKLLRYFTVQMFLNHAVQGEKNLLVEIRSEQNRKT